MIVFLHGVPETAAIWRKVREGLDQPSTALSLPGFGNPRPDGFAATGEAYAAWVVEQLAAIDEPIDLVGHDWGAGLTYLVAQQHGEAIRSWAADVGTIVHPDYVWHAAAQLWQSPDGEGFMAQMRESGPEAWAAGFEASYGVDHDDAMEMAVAIDEDMGSCILDLYRSATPNAFTRWGPWHPTATPGCVLDVTDDPFGDPTMSREVADLLGARVESVQGASHFWPYTAPDEGRAALQRFWATLA